MTAGANMNALEKVSESFLKFEVLNGHQNGSTLLHSACSGGNVEVVNVLLKAGAQTDALENVSRVVCE
jgi:ankyrin repeat protein